MKNLIKYYYDIMCSDIRKIQNHYEFTCNYINYCFLPCTREINEMLDIYFLMINNRWYCHEMVLNKYNSFTTIYENQVYLLIKKNIYDLKLLTFSDVLIYSLEVDKKIQNLWRANWIERIDYDEYQVNQFKVKYPKTSESFNYYVGLCETAIQLLNYVNYKNVHGYISHNKIFYKEKMDDYLNPLALIIDSRVRDVAEYIKINYLNLNLTLNQTIEMIQKIDFNRDEYLLFLSRLLYPNYYFEEYEKVINNKASDEKIDFYIKKNVYYETFLRQIYNYLKSNSLIFEIEWLEIKLH